VQKNGGTIYGKRAIERFLHRPAFELYDLEKDPDEVINLAEDVAHVSTRRELIDKLKAFQTATSDPWMHKWTYE
jgi:N-sulfoglucosamine sulfohydrolase